MEEIVDIHTQLQEKWMIFGWSLAFGLFTFAIAWRRGLFTSFHASPLPVIRGVDVFKGFLFFLFVEIIFIPMMVGTVLAFFGKDPEQFLNLHPQIKDWINVIIIIGGFFAILFVYFGLKSAQRKQLWQQNHQPWYYHFGIGIVTWFVCFPLVIAFSQLISIGAWHFFHHSHVEQVAVQHLRKVLDHPFLFIVTGIAVITIVPLTEEFLFRGLLQSWLKRKLNDTSLAIVISSLLFAFFHYSETHGVTNIELLSSLFLLSCMLGYIYERQRSLWAPLGLHSFFNLMSLLMIFEESVKV